MEYNLGIVSKGLILTERIFLVSQEQNGKIVNNIISDYLPKMKDSDRKKIIKFVCTILYFLEQKLNINYHDFQRQIRMNNNRNIIAICNLLLPYLDDKNNFYNQKNIVSIKDLIESKKKLQMLKKIHKNTVIFYGII